MNILPLHAGTPAAPEPTKPKHQPKPDASEIPGFKYAATIKTYRVVAVAGRPKDSLVTETLEKFENLTCAEARALAMRAPKASEKVVVEPRFDCVAAPDGWLIYSPWDYAAGPGVSWSHLRF